MLKYYLIINEDSSKTYPIGKLTENIAVDSRGNKTRNLNLSLYDADSAQVKNDTLLELSDFCIPDSIQKITVKNEEGSIVYESTNFTQFNSCLINLHDIAESEGEFSGIEYGVSATMIIKKEEA
jgi:hypothetical protein